MDSYDQNFFIFYFENAFFQNILLSFSMLFTDKFFMHGTINGISHLHRN